MQLGRGRPVSRGIRFLCVQGQARLTKNQEEKTHENSPHLLLFLLRFEGPETNLFLPKERRDQPQTPGNCQAIRDQHLC